MMLTEACWNVDPCSAEEDAGTLRCLVTAVLDKSGPLSRWAALSVAGHCELVNWWSALGDGNVGFRDVWCAGRACGAECSSIRG